MADDRAHRLLVPRRAGADGLLPADVPAVAAGRRARRYRRSPALDAAHAGRLRGRRAAVDRPRLLARGRAVDPAAVHLRARRVHSGAIALMEFGGQRHRFARGVASRDHAGGHGLQRRARCRPGAGRRGVRVARQRRGVRAGLAQRAGHDAHHAPPSAQAAPQRQAAGRAPVGRHAGRLALRPPFAGHLRATRAHASEQRVCREGEGAVAGDWRGRAAAGPGRCAGRAREAGHDDKN